MDKIFAALSSTSEDERYDAVCDLDDVLRNKPDAEVPAKAIEALEAMAFNETEWDELAWVAAEVWVKIIGVDAAVKVATTRYGAASGASKVFAAEVSCRYATREHLPILRELSRAVEPQVALCALSARVVIEGADARADVSARYESADEEHRGAFHDLLLLVTEGADRIAHIAEKLAETEDESVRISALNGLRAEGWRPGARSLVPRVLEIALEPSSEDEANAAHDALRSIGDPSVCDALFPLADFDEEEERCAITITRLGDPRAVERIIDIIGDSWNDEFTRTSWLWELAEAVALGNLEPALEQRAFDAALAMASDPDPYVLEFVSPYLAIMRPHDPVVAETLNRLAHADIGEEAHCAALAALAIDLEPAIVRDIMWEWLNVDDDPLALEFASMFAMREGDERWVPRLLEVVGEPESWATASKGAKKHVIGGALQMALMALGRIATPDAASRVRAVVDARADEPALSMLQALLFLGDPQDEHRWKALKKALGKKKGLARIMVLHGLAACGDDNARSALEKTLEAKSGPESMRHDAACALAALGHRVAIDRLVEVACMFQYHSAEEALLWLGRFARSDLRARQIIAWRLRGDELSKRAAARRAGQDGVISTSFVPQDFEAAAIG